MKKRTLILVFAMFLINLIPVSSYFYNISHNCINDICIEGQNADWYVKISNKGMSKIEYTAVELINSKDASLIASFKVDFNPLSSDRGNLVLVKPSDEVIIRLNSTLPPPDNNNQVVYRPCFTTATPPHDQTRLIEGIYEIKHCYSINESMIVFQCISDNNCDFDGICQNYKCLKLECEECQYIANHNCMDYECCDSETCKINEDCINNSCTKLNCRENEYLENHTCKALNCSYDEFIINKTCFKLNCGFNEFAFNHTCKKLNCSDNEYIDGNECRLLECEENEYAKNHTCNLLECGFNETFSNHACAPLDCRFFQKIQNHQCVNDKSFIYKLLAEIVVLILIILFLILDIKRYKSKYKKQQKVYKENDQKKSRGKF